MLKLFFKTIAYTLLVIVALGALAYVVAPSRYTVLVIGSDQRSNERSRSDVLFLVSIPKSTDEEALILTIPRDTQVQIEGYGLDKINHAYAYDEVSPEGAIGNAELTRRTVESFLDVPIDMTIELTFQGFVRFIDRLGGVEVSGQSLSGSQALDLVRNRSRGGGDFARTEDQRDLARGLLGELVTVEDTEQLWNVLTRDAQIKTHWNRLRAAHFGYGFFLVRAGRASLPAIHDDYVPGAGATLYAPRFGQNLYFWVPNEQELTALLDEHLPGGYKDKSRWWEFWK